MAEQSHYWSEVSGRYEDEFIDPYREGAESNPLLVALNKVPQPKSKSVADLGCGIGPLLPILAEKFGEVHAIDFAPGMLTRAKERCQKFTNIHWHQRSLTDLQSLRASVDLAVAVNSLVLPKLDELELALRQIRQMLRGPGQFMGILPSIDGVQYHTMLLVDRARALGQTQQQAYHDAATQAEHSLYDFAQGEFRYLGLEQHFWQPFEITYRLRRAGFKNIRKAKVPLAREQFACAKDLAKHPAPWDWFFSATLSASRSEAPDA